MKLTFGLVFITTFIIYILTFLIVFIFNINPLILQSEDIISTATTPFSILNEGNVNLDEYMPIMKNAYPNPDDRTAKPYYTVYKNGHYYSAFPLLTSLITTPLYIVPVVLKTTVDIDTIRIMSRIGGAFIAALATGVFFLILKNLLKSTKNILMLTFVFAFASNTYAISSQGVWQHGTSQLILGLLLLGIIKKNYYMAGFFAGIAYWARPTNLLSSFMFFAYLVWIYYDTLTPKTNTFIDKIKSVSLKDVNLQPLIKYSIGLFGGLLITMGFQTIVFGSIFGTAYGSAFDGFKTDLYHWLFGFLGLWLSPSKGILWISPVFLFMFYGFYTSFKSPRKQKLYFILTLTVILHTLALGKWYSWFGGYSWGYRMANDVIPYMTILLIPFMKSKYFKKRITKVLFVITLLYSLFVQTLGIIYYDGIWHTIYDGGWRNINWLWSIKNNQPLFSLKRALYKIHILKTDPVISAIKDKWNITIYNAK